MEGRERLELVSVANPVLLQEPKVFRRCGSRSSMILSNAAQLKKSLLAITASQSTNKSTTLKHPRAHESIACLCPTIHDSGNGLVLASFYSRICCNTASISRAVVSPSNLARTIPCPSTTKSHGSVCRFHSATVGKNSWASTFCQISWWV